jgi:hypothetical protein
MSTPLRELAPAVAWNEAMRRSMVVSIAGFFVPNLLANFGLIPQLCGKVVKSLVYASYHPRAFPRSVSVSLTDEADSSDATRRTRGCKRRRILPRIRNAPEGSALLSSPLRRAVPKFSWRFPGERVDLGLAYVP